MPQREFWTHRIPTSFVVRYQTDPVDPAKPSSVLIDVLDQERVSMDRATALVPANVIFECTADILRAAWEAYLFGEIGGLQRAIAPVLRAWRQEASSRPLWSELGRPEGQPGRA